MLTRIENTFRSKHISNSLLPGQSQTYPRSMQAFLQSQVVSLPCFFLNGLKFFLCAQVGSRLLQHSSSVPLLIGFGKRNSRELARAVQAPLANGLTLLLFTSGTVSSWTLISRWVQQSLHSGRQLHNEWIRRKRVIEGRAILLTVCSDHRRLIKLSLRSMLDILSEHSRVSPLQYQTFQRDQEIPRGGEATTGRNTSLEVAHKLN